MKKAVRKILVCIVVLMVMLSLSQIRAMADPKVNSAEFGLSMRDNYEAYQFHMPKDGNVKLNINLKDTDSIPGILTVSIQKSFKEGSPKIQEFAGITASTPVVDSQVALSEGDYYICYKLSNATGDLSYTSIYLYSTIEILPTVVTNIPELKVSAINSFSEITEKGYSELKFGDAEEGKNIVVPFTAKNGGGLYVSLKAGKESFDEIQGTIYKDKECTQPLGKSFSMEHMDDNTNYLRNLPEGGTYYIKFTLENEEDHEAVGETTFLAKLYEINGGDRIITNGKSTLSYQEKSSGKINYKITVKATSTLVIDVFPADNSKIGLAYFTLLDKNKKAITKRSTVYDDLKGDGTGYDFMQKYYTVPAGTYYVQVTASDSIYELVTYVHKYKANAGLNKAKAKSLKVQGTGGIGLFTTRDSTSKTDWYKFTINSRQYVQILLSSYLDGKFDWEIVDSRGKVIYHLNDNNGSIEGNYNYWSYGYFDKGTYYIKVNKIGNSSSLAYSLNLFNYDYNGTVN